MILPGCPGGLGCILCEMQRPDVRPDVQPLAPSCLGTAIVKVIAPCRRGLLALS